MSRARDWPGDPRLLRRRRGEDGLPGRRRTWLEGRVDVLLAALDEYGMGASAVPAAELIQGACSGPPRTCGLRPPRRGGT